MISHEKAQRTQEALILCAFCAFFWLIPGCADLKGYGVSRWPLYRELPESAAVSEAEKAQLKTALPPELLERVKALNAECAYYREIVRSHNNAAADKWLKIEKGLGADEDELSQLTGIMEAKVGRTLKR